MKIQREGIWIGVLLLTITTFVFGQEKHYYQTDFPKEEFAERRARLFEKIGKNAVAVVQGAKGTADFNVFRQSNEFYYLTGIETPHAYLVLDGRNQRTAIYLPHRDADRERSEGKMLSAEDGDLVKDLTGIDQVRSLENLSQDLVGKGVLRPLEQTVATNCLRSRRAFHRIRGTELLRVRLGFARC
jgi:Xaa-Pro aminopeptidase